MFSTRSGSFLPSNSISWWKILSLALTNDFNLFQLWVKVWVSGQNWVRKDRQKSINFPRAFASSFKNESFYAKKDEAHNCTCNECRSGTGFPQVSVGPLGLGTALQQCPPARTPRNGGWSAAWNSLALDLLQVGQKASVSLDFSPALGGHCRVKVPQSHSLCGWSITGPAEPGKAPLAFPRESVGEDHGFPRMLFPWETGLVRVGLELLLHLA